MEKKLYVRNKLIYEVDIEFRTIDELFLIEYKCNDGSNLRHKAYDQLTKACWWYHTYTQFNPRLLYVWGEYQHIELINRSKCHKDKKISNCRTCLHPKY